MDVVRLIELLTSVSYNLTAMKRILILLPVLFALLLGACASKDASGTSTPERTELKKENRIEGYIRPSELIIKDKEAEAETFEPAGNPYSDLSIPTWITKVDDTYFIVDCYHDQIIYNDNLTDPLSEWLVMTDRINKGHTLASDGTVYLADDTENERILVFEKTGGKFVLTQQFKDITSRPHYIVYHEPDETFYSWSSTSGQMYLFRREKDDTRMYLTNILSIPELDGVYVRSFTIIGNDIYFVSGNSKILKADLETFEITGSYPVPAEIAGMIQLTKIDGEFYITVSTDAYWNQEYATMIRCRSLEDLAQKKYEDIYEYFIGGGTPYYITKIGTSYYLTEHRIPGHSIWRFSVDEGRINASAVY